VKLGIQELTGKVKACWNVDGLVEVAAALEKTQKFITEEVR
jgi:hypothetical protein